MDFYAMLKQLEQGKTATRAMWHSPEINVRFMEGLPSPQLMIKSGTFNDNLYHPWILTVEDVTADDWELVADIPVEALGPPATPAKWPPAAELKAGKGSSPVPIKKKV